MTSLLEPDFGMRSVIAAACILPWAAEEAGACDTAPAEFVFVTDEDVSGVATVNERVTSAAEFAGGAVGSEAGRAEETGDVFDPDEECAGTSESQKYHVPMAAAAMRPAAIAIQIPLLLPRDLVSPGVLSLSSELPNSGATGACFDAAGAFFPVRFRFFAVTCFGADADSGVSVACRSSSLASSAGGAGMAALRANGSSQAGIFTSSSSKLDVAGICVFFDTECAEELKPDLAGALSSLGGAGSSFTLSKIFAAASPSSRLEDGATETAGFPSPCFCSAN
jgi:hypothetical protein